VGTDKRARQKAGRQARLEALQKQQQQAKRKRSVLWAVGTVVAIALVGLGINVFFGGGGDDSDAAATATTVPASDSATPSTAAGPFVYGTGACPPDGYTGPPKKSFDDAPQLCIDPAKTYTATIKTSEGDVVVALDTQRTPGTVNNFVVLSEWHYYDDTKLFRTNTSIGIIQGGGVDNTGGPGYEIPDEGLPFQYHAGDLTMANTGAPDSGGAQWFFGATDAVSGLDAQGTYTTFGHVTQGMDVLQKIMALHKDSGTQPGEGAPSHDVTVSTVEIAVG
jgi:cyclophilin family peptidyl-prolyl cis-trans isomerase